MTHPSPGGSVPGPLSLRPYQSKAVADIYSAFEDGANAVCFVAPCGAGKTLIMAEMARLASEHGTSTVILTHRDSLIQQTCEKLDKAGVSYSVIAPGRNNYGDKVQVASVQTLARRPGRYQFGFIMVDECFPAGTLVGGKPIETICSGEHIASFNHENGCVEMKSVLSRFEREYTGPWYRISSIGGSDIICTEGHPIFTRNRGYVPARLLTLHDELVIMAHDLPELLERNNCFSKIEQSKKSVQGMQSEVLGGIQTQGSRKNHSPGLALPELLDARSIRAEKKPQGGVASRLRILFKKLYWSISPRALIEGDDGDESEDSRRDIFKDEVEQSDGELGGSRPRASYADPNKASTEISRRERKARPGAATAISRCSWMADGIHRSGRERAWSWLADSLQAGHREFVAPAMPGSRWRLPRFERSSVAGCQERQILTISRVDRIEVFKRDGHDKPSWVPEKNTVYNLHVEENENYFANGVLVHNCHRALTPSYKNIFAEHTEALICGFTASPMRTGGQGLDTVFDRLVLGPTPKELIAEKFLAKPVTYGPLHKMDLSGVRTVAGDYDIGDLTEAVDRTAITGSAIKEYSRLCPGEPAIAFCCSILHAEHVANDFRSAGYRADHVSGAMPRDVVRSKLAALASGEIQVLTACDLLTEGVDSPSVRASILLRPTKSLIVYIQSAGRALRPKPDGSTALILDHAGSFMKFGLIDDDREWTLEGRKKRARAGDGIAAVPVRQCSRCYLAHKPAPVCPGCGFVYLVEVRKPEVIAGELAVIDAAALRRVRQKEEREARTYKQLCDLAKKRQYSISWPLRKWCERGGDPRLAV